jgi:hypothetical protein
MSKTGQPDGTLTTDQLAQFRGCGPSNDCYWLCCEAAAAAISGNWNPEELAVARIWAAKETWV